MKTLSIVALLFASLLMAISAEPDYAEPQLLTGRIIARGSTNVLYQFRRTATRNGNTVQVLRVFTYPDGKLAARERVTYVNGKLSAFQLDEMQIDAQGNTQVTTDAKSQKTKLSFDYTIGAK